MAKGFCYLVAIMDWASRRVLSWRLSNTLDTMFCTEALEEALERFGNPKCCLLQYAASEVGGCMNGQLISYHL